MKQYKKYKTGEVFILEHQLSTREKKILDKFLLYCSGTAGERKLNNIKTKILQIRDISQVPYDQWNLDTLREFNSVLKKSTVAAATKNDTRRVLKRFLREQYPDWSKRFKDLKDIKQEYEVNEKRVNANTIFNSEELEKLLRGTDSLKLKSLIILMYESGARPGEVLSLRWEDIDLGKKEVKLTSTKNKKVRVNPLDKSIIHLKRYKQEYPFENITPKDYVFPSKTDRKKPIAVTYFSGLFRDIAKRTIGRNAHPNLIRHTRSTELQKKLTPKVYEKFMDHSIKMATRYSHLDKDDVREAMIEHFYNVEEITEEQKEDIEKLKEKIKSLETNHDIKLKALMRYNYLTYKLQEGKINSEEKKELKQMNLIMAGKGKPAKHPVPPR